MLMLVYIKLLALSLVQDSVIFKPRPSGIQAIKTASEYGFKDASEEIITTEDGEQIHCWVEKPSNPSKPYIVFFHGNTGHLGDVGKPKWDEEKIDRSYRINFLKTMEKHGYGFIAVSHRGYGKSTGKPSEEGFVKDIKAVAELIKERNLKIIISGESLGAFSALTLMQQMEYSEDKPLGVVLIAPFSNLEEKAYETHPEFRRFDAKKYLRYGFDNKKIISETNFKGRILILHPQQDKTTGNYHSEILLGEGRKRGLDMKLVILQNYGHVTWDAEVVLKYLSQEIH